MSGSTRGIDAADDRARGIGAGDRRARARRARGRPAAEAGRAGADAARRAAAAAVELEELAADDPLAILDGQANALEIDTWPLGRIVITQRDGGLEKTAYALLTRSRHGGATLRDDSAHERSRRSSGLTILDLSRVLSGPYCTMLAADMGARVIKIEHPVRGDDTRAWGPPFLEGESAYYLSINRNKESVARRFQDAEGGRRVLDALIARADVLVENFRPGTLERLGLGYDDRRRAPSATRSTCRSRASARTGRAATRPATTPSRRPRAD